jgi:hypothetical protein
MWQPASSCLSVCLSAWSNFTPTWQIFMKFYIWRFLKNLSRKFQFHYNLTRITVLYTKTYVHWYYLAEFILECGMFQTEVVQKITTHILCSVIFFKLCHLWNNVDKYARPRWATDDNIICHIHLAYQINKRRIQTQTQSIHCLLLFQSNDGYVNMPEC